MDPSREEEIVARLSRIESAVAALQRSVDQLISGASHAARAFPGPAAPRTSEPPPRPFASRQYDAAPLVTPRPQPAASDDIGATIASWFSSRSPEWWLSRLGVGFVVIAIL